MLLLPPSEGKAPGGDGPPWSAAAHAFPALDADREAVRDAVRQVLEDHAAASRLLGVRGPHLERALREWEDLDDAPTRPAAERYTGVVWDALGPPRMDRVVRRRLDARVLVPSGLWGLLAATDPVPAHRLKMGARIPRLGGLAAWWRPRIAPLIEARAGGGWVFDLLPDEYAAALDPGLADRVRLARVEILDGPSGRATGHAGKALKGLLARAMLEADVRTPRALGGLVVPGLTHAGDVSGRDGGVTRVVFVRTA